MSTLQKKNNWLDAGNNSLRLSWVLPGSPPVLFWLVHNLLQQFPNRLARKEIRVTWSCVGSCMVNVMITRSLITRGWEVMNTDSLSSCSFACSSCLTRLSASSARSSVSFSCWVRSLTLSLKSSSRAAAYGERKKGRITSRKNVAKFLQFKTKFLWKPMKCTMKFVWCWSIWLTHTLFHTYEETLTVLVMVLANIKWS